MKKKFINYFFLILIFIAAFFIAKHFMPNAQESNLSAVFYDSNGNVLDQGKDLGRDFDVLHPFSFIMQESSTVTTVPDSAAAMKLKVTLINTGNWFFNVSLSGNLGNNSITFSPQIVQLPRDSTPIIVETDIISLTGISRDVESSVVINAVAASTTSSSEPEVIAYTYKFKKVCPVIFRTNGDISKGINMCNGVAACWIAIDTNGDNNLESYVTNVQTSGSTGCSKGISKLMSGETFGLPSVLTCTQYGSHKYTIWQISQLTRTATGEVFNAISLFDDKGTCAGTGCIPSGSSSITFIEYNGEGKYYSIAGGARTLLSSDTFDKRTSMVPVGYYEVQAICP
jgi:hypothetical protein